MTGKDIEDITNIINGLDMIGIHQTLNPANRAVHLYKSHEKVTRLTKIIIDYTAKKTSLKYKVVEITGNSL